MMMDSDTATPRLRQAAIIIANDCGMRNRDTPEPEVAALETLRVTFTPAHVAALETALHGLSDDDLETACIGEHDARVELLSARPLVGEAVGLLYELLLGGAA